MPVNIQIAPQSRIKSRTPKSRSRPKQSDTRVGACDPQGFNTEYPRNVFIGRRRTLGAPSWTTYRIRYCASPGRSMRH